MSLNNPPKPNTDQSLIDAFLRDGGTVTKGKTKPMAPELGISNNTWNQKLTKDEKAAKTK